MSAIASVGFKIGELGAMRVFNRVVLALSMCGVIGGGIAYVGSQDQPDDMTRDEPSRLAALSPPAMPRAGGGGVALSRPASSTTAVAIGAPATSAPSGPSLAINPLQQSGPLQKDEISSALQSELRRVGCYRGSGDGAWSPATRQAMAGFLQQARVDLPTERADMVLLTLVRSYAGPVCTAECDGPAAAGQCGRSAPMQSPAMQVRIEPERPPSDRVVAHAAPPKVRVTATAKAQAQSIDTPIAPSPATGAAVVSSRGEPMEGRMAVGGPVGLAGAPVTEGTSAISTGSLPSRLPVPKPHQQPAAAPRPRRDTAWTGSFFSDRR